MTSIQSLASGRKDMLMIDPKLIQEKPGWNQRLDTPELAAHIRMLADSIKEIGVQIPLSIYMEADTVYVSDGHCRRAATLLAMSEGAEIKAIPCLVVQKGATEAEMVADMLTRNSGRPLSGLEIANVASRLLGFGWTLEQVAKRAGLTEAWLNSLLGLRAAPQGVLSEVQAGNVSPSLAARLVASEGGQKAAKIIAKTQAKMGREKITKKDLPKARDPKALSRMEVALVARVAGDRSNLTREDISVALDLLVRVTVA